MGEENGAQALVAKVCRISEAVGTVGFDSKNTHQKYEYTSAAGLIQKVNAAAAKEGVSIMAVGEDLVNYESGEAVVKVTLAITDGIAQFTTQGLGEGRSNKAVMIAATSAYKYALAHAFLLSWGALDAEDDKHNTPAKKPSARAPRASKKTQPDLVKQIAEAKTNEELDTIKAAIRLLRETDRAQYDAARKAFTARQSLLEGE